VSDEAIKAETVDRFLERWHECVARRDTAGIGELVADDISMGAPPYWNKLEGKPLVVYLLGVIVHSIEGFTYHRQWRDGRELALEFRGHYGKHELQGIDLITLADDGRVANLDVMIRPIDALLALRDHVGPEMAKFLAAGES